MEGNVVIIDKEVYSEFITDESKLEFFLGGDEEPEIVSQILHTILERLKFLDENGDIENFTIEGNRFEINASRYIIHVLVLHSGDVFLYPIHKKTNYKSKSHKRMGIDSEAVLKMIKQFI